MSPILWSSETSKDSNKPIVKSVSLAEGPRTPEPVPSTKSSWTQSSYQLLLKQYLLLWNSQRHFLLIR